MTVMMKTLLVNAEITHRERGEFKTRCLTEKKNLHKSDTFLLLFLELHTYFIPASNCCPGFIVLTVACLLDVVFKSSHIHSIKKVKCGDWLPYVSLQHHS